MAIYVAFFYIARSTLPHFNVFNTMKIAFYQITPQLNEIMKLSDKSDKYIVPEGKAHFKGLNFII